MKILIPTLNLQQAEKTIRRAVATAGIPNVEAEVVVDESGEGFTATVNRGLEGHVLSLPKGYAGDVCLLNDDAMPLADGWLAILKQEMDRRKALNVWFAGPSGPCRTAPQNGGRIGDHRRPRLVGWLAGFCLLIEVEAIEKLGGLDDRFIHYAAEVSYQRRARRDFGARSLWVPSVYVEHELHPPRQPWWDEDQQLLRAIWG